MTTRDEIAALLRDTDWSATPLGARETWPKTLEGYVSMIREMPTPAIVFWGPEQTQIYNAGYAVIMGPRHPKHFGGTYRECWPDTYPTIHPWMRKVLEHGETIEVDRALVPVTRHAWKEEAYFTFTFSPLRDDEGNIRGIFQPVLEVTPAVLAERRASTLRLLSRRGDASSHGSLARAMDGLAENAADVPFALVYLRDRATRRLSLAASAGASSAMLHERARARGEALAARALAEGGPFDAGVSELFDEPHGGPLGEPTTRMTVLPLEDDRGALLCGTSPVLAVDDAYRLFLGSVAREIVDTIAWEERHLMEREVLERERHARTQAEEANRMKDEFLATMSHELRTPLNAILGWSTLLASGDLDDETRKRALETIDRNARAQTRLVEDILDVSRISSGKLSLSLERASVRTVALAALDIVRPAAGAKGMSLEVDLPDDELAITGDPGRLQQVVWNLLSNAVRYTPAGGTVRLAARRLESVIAIEVADTGVGIEPEHLPFVFERFRQVDSSTTRRHGGLGLGLAIVRHLVELHGGTVHAESQGSGKGATFTVRLPVRAIAPPPSDRSDAKSPSRSGRHTPAGDARLSGIRILVVDDDADSLEMIASALELAGADVGTATSASRAFEEIQSSPPDLLVSDIGMPEEDGYSLIDRVRRLPADLGGTVPAIALTAYARAADRDRALAAGFQRHLAKPVDPLELVRAAGTLSRRR